LCLVRGYELVACQVLQQFSSFDQTKRKIRFVKSVGFEWLFRRYPMLFLDDYLTLHMCHEILTTIL
jgi:hypothetical protein